MASVGHDFMYFAGFRIDPAAQQLWHGSRPVDLRPSAWALLVALLARPGALVDNHALADALWPGRAVTPKALTNRIAQLRDSLGDDSARQQIIQTVPRRGYRFIATVTRGPGPCETVPDAVPHAAACTAAGAASGGPGGGAPLRAAELGRLQGALQAADAGRRQVVLVGGEPGLGKTWLLDGFAAALPADAVLLGRGQCIAPSSAQESFGLWLAVLADLCAVAAAHVVPLLRRCAPSWLLQLPWLQQDDEAAALQQDLAGAATGRMLREGCALFEALAQRHTLVLLLDDLHWADAASVDLLQVLLRGRSPARLLVVACWRPVDARLHGHPMATLAEAGSHGALPLQQVLLQPLDNADAARLLQGQLGDATLARRLLPRAQRATQGNPLVLVAAAQHLHGTGAAAPAWTPLPGVEGAAADTVVPGPLRLVVASRLAALTEDERRLLQAASVVGPVFTPALVAAALQAEPAALALSCQAVAARQLFIRAHPDVAATGHHAFLHDAYRQALYDTLPPHERRQLHARVARHIEHGAGRAGPDTAAMLAGAYLRAALPADAARMLERTAEVSLGRFDHRAAVQALQLAVHQLGLLPDDDTVLQAQVRLHLMRGNVLQMLRTGHPDAAPAFATARLLAQRRGDVRSCVRALLGLCLARVLEGRLGQAVEVAADLVALAEAEQPGLAAAAHAYAGVAALGHGRLAAAQAHCERALGLPADPEVPAFIDLPSLALCTLGQALVEQGRHTEGLRHVDASVARGRARAAQPHLMQSLYWAAETYRQAAAARSAAGLFDEVAAQADRASIDSFSLAARFGRLACADPAPGRSAAMARLVERRTALGEAWNAAGFALALAQAGLADGDLALCRTALARGLALQGGDQGTRHLAALQALAKRVGLPIAVPGQRAELRA